MVNTIVSEMSPFVLPSHRGLSRLEIVQDCIRKNTDIGRAGYWLR